METLQLSLFIVQIIAAILLIGIILVQKTGGDSLSGIGGSSMGSNTSFLSERASASILTKATITLAIIFMINCLVLATISARIVNKNQSQIEEFIEQKKKNDPSVPTIPDVD